MTTRLQENYQRYVLNEEKFWLTFKCIIYTHYLKFVKDNQKWMEKGEQPYLEVRFKHRFPSTESKVHKIPIETKKYVVVKQKTIKYFGEPKDDIKVVDEKTRKQAALQKLRRKRKFREELKEGKIDLNQEDGSYRVETFDVVDTYCESLPLTYEMPEIEVRVCEDSKDMCVGTEVKFMDSHTQTDVVMKDILTKESKEKEIKCSECARKDFRIAGVIHAMRSARIERNILRDRVTFLRSKLSEFVHENLNFLNDVEEDYSQSAIIGQLDTYSHYINALNKMLDEIVVKNISINDAKSLQRVKEIFDKHLESDDDKESEDSGFESGWDSDNYDDYG